MRTRAPATPAPVAAFTTRPSIVCDAGGPLARRQAAGNSANAKWQFLKVTFILLVPSSTYRHCRSQPVNRMLLSLTRRRFTILLRQQFSSWPRSVAFEVVLSPRRPVNGLTVSYVRLDTSGGGTLGSNP